MMSIRTSSEMFTDDVNRPDKGTQVQVVAPRKQKKIDGIRTVMEWIDLIPKVPSYYCGKSSKRLYIE